MTKTVKPILMSPPLVAKTINLEKYQTRRISDYQPPEGSKIVECYYSPTGWAVSDDSGACSCNPVICRHGEVGGYLWVRENGWQPPEFISKKDLRDGADTWPSYMYDADGIDEQEADELKSWGWRRRPSIHMPKEFNRLVLEIKKIRVERLQDISYPDAVAEGVPVHQPRKDNWAIDRYKQIWESINGHGSWDINPWVWVIDYYPIGININELLSRKS